MVCAVFVNGPGESTILILFFSNHDMDSHALHMSNDQYDQNTVIDIYIYITAMHNLYKTLSDHKNHTCGQVHTT